MSLDRTLICRDCGAAFAFTAGEQDFYDRKGFTRGPSRCRACRGPGYQARRSDPRAGEAGALAERRVPDLFEAVCSQCGQQAQVPALAVLSDAPVYCAACAASRQHHLYAATGGWREEW
jgi:CxxC-x17-CxxC domain-containing protein